MFSFFKNKSANIDSIDIPDFGWEIVKNSDAIVQWINPESTIGLSKHYFGIPPDLPASNDLEGIRAFYRDLTSGANAGIIEVDLLRIQGLAVIQTLFKFPQQPTGMTYLGSLTIPFQKSSFVVKVQCAEVGYTGFRDSVIAAKLVELGEVTIGDDGYENWFSDPYDPGYSGKTLMNKSEQRMYDQDFPNHPLTRARNIMDRIVREIKFKPEIRNLRPFYPA